MGSGTVPTARPVHTVQITKGYWLGKYEVTQAEYKAVTGLDPSGRKGVRNPVGTVSWDDAVAFCAKLTEWERAGGRLPAGYEYRLPSEAEWEYAARGATKSQGFALSGSDRPDEVGWFRDNAEGVHHPVGQKKPNELGLCDMSGNVWEWCLDAYDETYYSRSPGSDPVNTQATTSRATRGGSWDASPDYMRVAERSYLPPGTRGENYGFRACLAPRPGRD